MTLEEVLALPGINILIGLLIGLIIQWFTSKLNRKNDHLRWLREERARVFGEVQRCVDNSSRSAKENLAAATNDAEYRVLHAWQPSFTVARVARLYMSAEDGDRIVKLVHEMYSAFCSYHIRSMDGAGAKLTVLHTELENLMLKSVRSGRDII